MKTLASLIVCTGCQFYILNLLAQIYPKGQKEKSARIEHASSKILEPSGTFTLSLTANEKVTVLQKNLELNHALKRLWFPPFFSAKCLCQCSTSNSLSDKISVLLMEQG